MSLKLAWTILGVQNQPELYSKTLFQNKIKIMAETEGLPQA